MAKVHKGWLKTREGDYFSPNTLAESLYSREGTKYDDVVKGYVQSAKIELETTQMTISQKVDDLYDKLKNFDGSDSDTFYILDSDGNIILKVDTEGGHSIDFKSLNYSLEEIGDTLDNIEIDDDGVVTAKDFKNQKGDSFNSTREELSTLQTEFVDKFKNLDTSDADTLYIVDSDGNIIVKVDDTGVTSINFNVPDLISYVELVELVNAHYEEFEEKLDNAKELLQNNIDGVQTNLDTFVVEVNNRLKNFNGDDSDTLYITDTDGNVIAKVDAAGVSSINFTTPEANLNDVAADLIAEIDAREKDVEALEKKDAEQQIEIQANATEITNIYNKIKYFSNDGTTFLVINSDGQTLMEVTSEGATVNNVVTSQYDVNAVLAQLLAGLDQEIADREAAITNLTNHVDTSLSTLQKNFDDRLKNFDGSDSDILYITDSAGNIIARVDSTGVHSINFTTSDYDVNNMLSSLDERIIQEIADRAAGDKTVQEYVDATAQTIQQSLTQTDNKVNILIGDDSNKSVRTIANEELAAQLLSGKADADFQTLQQLAAWLEDHPEDVAAINLAIQVIQGQLGGFEQTTNAVKNYIDNAINTLQLTMDDRLKNFDGSDSDALYIVDSSGYKIAQVDKDGVTSINFITNEYNVNDEFASLDQRIKDEASLRASQDEVYYNKHKDELDTHTVWDTNEHTTLQNNINSNTQLINNVNSTLDNKIDTVNNDLNDKIVQEATDRENADTALNNHINDSISTLQTNIDNRLKNFDGSDSDVLYIVDSNGYKIAQVDKDGVTSINFITNQYNMNTELASLSQRIDNEASTRASQDEVYYKKHQDELDTHTVWDTNEHTALGNRITDNTNLINNVNSTLDTKIDNVNSTLDAKIDKEISDRENADNSLTDYIDDSINTLQSNVDNRLKNFDGSDSDTLYITDSNNYKIAQVDKDGVTSINFISNQYDMNEEFASLDKRIEAEAATRAAQDEAYYNKHTDELNTHTVWDTEEHTTLQNNINSNTDLINSVNQSLTEQLTTQGTTINARIDDEVEELNNTISAAVQKHTDELNTHTVWDTNEHTTLQNNINSNTQYTTDTKNELLDKIKFYENEGVDGSDTLYIVDGNGYKLAQFDKDGITTTYVKATDFTAGNGFTFSGAMFYTLQGSIDTFPDGI